MAPTVDPMAYKQVLVVLATAGIVIPLFLRLKLPPILGFLMVGIVVGPSVLGQLSSDYPWLSYFVVTDDEEIETLAELGVVFLLFMIGIELSFKRLWAMRRLVFGVGALQVGLSMLVIGSLAALYLPPSEAIVVGAAISLSSTAIVVELLSRQKRLRTHAGRTAFSVLLFQDLAVVPLLLLVGALGREEEGVWWTGLVTAVRGGVTILLVVLVGRYLLRPFLRLVAQTRSPDLFLAAVLLIIVGTALVTNLSGLSMAFGAFVAGLVLAETEFRREIEALIEPVRGLFLGAFFLLVGMGIDVAEVAARPMTIAGLALVLIVLKATVIGVIGVVFRIGRGALLESALLLGPGGEFAFVLLGAAAAAKVIAPATSETVSILVSVSMAALPFLAMAGRRLALRLEGKSLPPEAEIAPPEDGGVRVIVAGFGRVGRLVAALLKEHSVPYLAADTDAPRVARMRREGWPVYFGDATRPAFLRTCGVEDAQILVITVDDHSKVDEMVGAARGLNPNLRIIVRARDQTHAQRLYRAGAAEAVPETTEASLQLAESVLVEAGIPMGLAIASIHEHRDAYRKLLGRPDRRRLLAAEKYGKPPAAP